MLQTLIFQTMNPVRKNNKFEISVSEDLGISEETSIFV